MKRDTGKDKCVCGHFRRQHAKGNKWDGWKTWDCYASKKFKGQAYNCSCKKFKLKEGR